MYVVLEGIDTCGKSTQIKELHTLFPHAIYTKEPGGSEIGSRIREMILYENISKKAEFFLFLADRAEHFHTIIKPHLNELIISDRSLISGIAYAEYAQAEDINMFCAEGIVPDLCFVLRIPKHILMKRLASKSTDKIEERGIAYLLHIQERIIHTAKSIAKQTIIIEANDTKHSITDQIASAITKALM